ncbi:SNF2 family N-terminal domain-containing protein [Mycena pura]|uniref:SNF2 family N-terminal domain-containing protein n=1 Tax=Mycena pura TaxID=153505 RepID=A0AAD6UWG9_9AGAR|nr:SNF2 family N-terminal domain-containing protein [Mycena pura]
MASGTSIPAHAFYKATPAAPCPVDPSSSSLKTVVKRKRDPDAQECDDDTRARNLKARKDERDAERAEITSVRTDLEIHRKNWLYANRGLFEPLVPSHPTAFLTQLIKEMEGKATAPSPRHDFVAQPDLVVGGEMKAYQLAGLSFLADMFKNGINCILGDEMGLGKTLQTLSLFAHIKETAPANGPAMTHLIVCPLSVLSSWEAECRRWVPSMRVQRFHGPPVERERIKNLMRAAKPPFDIVLTTYESLSAADHGWFKAHRWTCVVLDEGHRIKNSDTEVASRVAALGGLWRIILTGTPIQNNLIEVWGLLHWLFPQIFTQKTRALFASSFDLAAGTYALPVLDAVRALLGAIQLRRTKGSLTASGALGGVPPRKEWTVFIPLTEAQRFWTYRLLTLLDKVDLELIFPRSTDDSGPVDDGRREVLKDLVNQAQGSATTKQWQKFSMLLMQLRRICDHPYMIDDAMPEQYEIGEHLVAASSKLLAIDKIFAQVLPMGERILIFSDHLVLRDIKFLRLDGQVSRPRREMVIRMVGQYQVFLISTKAGGLGINLTKASTVILCDSDWNPQNDLQAIARAHRIGQTKEVQVYRLVCRASVEDQMLDRIRRKLFLSAKIIGAEAGGGGEEQNADGPQGGSELMAILRRGSSALTHSDDGMDLARFRAASLQEILDVSRAREDVHVARVKHELQMDIGNGDAKEAEQLLQSAEEEERALLSGVARVQSYLFEGTLLERAKPAKDVGVLSLTPLKKRERVDRTVSIGGMSFIVDDSMVETVNPKAKVPFQKKKKEPFESEDYCIACRDGGELVLCGFCPRVFHAECHPTLAYMTAAQIQRTMMVACTQHVCAKCARSTSGAGGMLMRCQTCPQAICTDCVDWDNIKLVGDTIPEFVLRKFGPTDSATFIRCSECREQAKIDPVWAAEWESEISESQRLLGLM